MPVLPLCACGCGRCVTKPTYNVIYGHHIRDDVQRPSVVKTMPLCLCGCGYPVTHPANTFLKGHSGRYYRGTEEERFFRCINKTETCWIWIGAIINTGYGTFSFNKKHKLAHRASWELHYGPIPNNLQVLHNCPGGDNRACVNPQHLFLGTQADNVSDYVKKGRHPSRLYPETIVHGSRIGTSKLLEEQVVEIHSLHGILTWKELMKRYDISQTTLYRIFRGELWHRIWLTSRKI